MMHTLWLRAETKLNERRTPLIPAHARILVKNGYRVCVEASRDRIFSNSAYRKQGCILVEKGSWRFASRDTLILGAVSNTKCNSWIDDNTLLCTVINEDFAWPAPSKCFSRASIQVQCNRIKLALREL